MVFAQTQHRHVHIRSERSHTKISKPKHDYVPAFDRINHRKLFEKLIHRNTPGYLIRIHIFWYTNQSMVVRWGDAVSEPFKVSNGVRQGGILSPYLFNVYMDDLSGRLDKCMTGCVIGEIILNHLMYADDLVILSPYSAGLQQLLSLCSEFGIENDIRYNAAKSNVMIVDEMTKGVQRFSLSWFCAKWYCIASCNWGEIPGTLYFRKPKRRQRYKQAMPKYICTR